MPTVLVTGANRGLGLEFVRQYAADGWKVLACCRAPDEADELRDCTREHVVHVEQLDVTDFEAVDALANAWRRERIDVLINNAGLFGPKAQAERDPRQSLGHLDYGIWSSVLRTNLMAPLKMVEAFVEQVAASEQRKIVTISSSEGSIAGAKSGVYAYRTSKAAVNMAMALLANDLRERGIAVAAFCPGWVATRMGGEGAPLSAGDSVAGLRKQIGSLRPETSGRFLRYDGEPVPW